VLIESFEAAFALQILQVTANRTLKQAFAEGEPWKVRRERAEKLRAARLTTDEQFHKFMTETFLDFPFC
jgi:hypothetical protein